MNMKDCPACNGKGSAHTCGMATPSTANPVIGTKTSRQMLANALRRGKKK